jgi:HK97 family phage portal protein
MGILRRTVVDWLGKVVEAEKVDSAEALVQLEAEKCCFMEAARTIMCGYVTAALQKSDIVFIAPNATDVDIDVYRWLWNVSPNANQNRSEFIASLTNRLLNDKDGEALVVPIKRRGNTSIYVADSFSTNRQPGRMHRYENIVVEGDSTIAKGYYLSGDAYHFSVDGDNGWAELMRRFNAQYQKLGASAMAAMMDRNSKKWKMRINAPAAGTEQDRLKVQAYLDAVTQAFRSNENVLLPEYTDYTLEEFSTDATRRATDSSSDVTSIRKDMFESVAECFRMPTSLLYGNTNNFAEILSSFLTFAVDPVAVGMGQEITRKTFSMREWATGAKATVDTTRVRHVDIFQIADAAAKLVGSSIDSPNEVRGFTGQERIDADWADEYQRTKNNELAAGGEQNA